MARGPRESISAGLVHVVDTQGGVRDDRTRAAGGRIRRHRPGVPAVAPDPAVLGWPADGALRDRAAAQLEPGPRGTVGPLRTDRVPVVRHPGDARPLRRADMDDPEPA